MTMARVWLANGVCRVRSPRRNRGRGHDESKRRAARRSRNARSSSRADAADAAASASSAFASSAFASSIASGTSPLVLRLLGGAAPRQKRDQLPARIRGGPRAGRDPLRFAPREEALEERGAILLLGRQRERRRERRVRGASGRRLDALRFQPNQLRLELAKTRRRRRFFVPVGDVSVSVSVRGRRVESRQRIENRLLSLLLFLGERAVRAPRRLRPPLPPSPRANPGTTRSPSRRPPRRREGPQFESAARAGQASPWTPRRREPGLGGGRGRGARGDDGASFRLRNGAAEIRLSSLARRKPLSSETAETFAMPPRAREHGAVRARGPGKARTRRTPARVAVLSGAMSSAMVAMVSRTARDHGAVRARGAGRAGRLRRNAGALFLPRLHRARRRARRRHLPDSAAHLGLGAQS